MSELTLTVIRLGFLAVLWLLVLSVTSAMRADLFGVRPPKPPKQSRAAARQSKQPKAGKGLPSRVVIVEGPDTGRSVPLHGAPVTFGRGDDCTLPLADEYISTQHARLRFHEGQWYVEDLGSTNGTYVGHERLTRSTPVNVKSRFRLGKTVVELRK
ncbi:FHA domain-containing protein FhaB/FipA [Phytoactinopolyspora halotolerans]|uniref:FHA domain-containing protein n=1 Tax=Phytoactinopolyspora halotolerans TaxID=1981512 RepID=A0A6L9S265_9ACTN|nr:FHA domain-containing protein [Phytoactinopolyspora halotolerans]NED98723.1 FHA domain-containing protein [Phytoactinopolyspora halotolerans]